MKDLCREHRISEAMYYVWNKVYAGLGLSELPSSGSSAREPEAQAARRGSLVDRRMLHDIMRKKL